MNNTKLYPLQFISEPHEKVWGGNRIKEILNIEFSAEDYPGLTGKEPIGESWEISGMIDDSSIVENGFFAENSLEEFVDTYMGDAIGENIFQYYRGQFPLLLKVLDVEDKLSLQVHPDNITAMEREESYGKAECWYVMEAEPTATIYMGFNREITPKEFYERCQNGTVKEVLNAIHPKKGDTFYIAPGTVHAAEGGLLIAEVQQCSDITYRLYDWGREFNPATARKMHLNEAIDIIDYKKFNPRLHYSNIFLTFSDTDTLATDGNKSVAINNTEYFIINAIELSSAKRIYPSQAGSFILYIAIEGETEIVTNDKNVLKLQRGRSVMIPASMEDFIIRPAENISENGAKSENTRLNSAKSNESKLNSSKLSSKSVVLEIYLPQPQEEEDNYLI